MVAIAAAAAAAATAAAAAVAAALAGIACHILLSYPLCHAMMSASAASPYAVALLHILIYVQATIAKLMPTPEAHMAVLCVLGPLAVVPFAIVRVGTGHLYLWAMGMISALYVGMPIIAGAPHCHC